MVLKLQRRKLPTSSNNQISYNLITTTVKHSSSCIPFSPQSSQDIHLECWECAKYIVQERIYIDKEQNKTFLCVVLTAIEG